MSREYRHRDGIFLTVVTVQTAAKEGERRNPQGLYEMSVLTAIQLLRRMAVDAFFLFFCPVSVALPALYFQSSYSLTVTVNVPELPPFPLALIIASKLSSFIIFTSHSPSCSL